MGPSRVPPAPAQHPQRARIMAAAAPGTNHHSDSNAPVAETEVPGVLDAPEHSDAVFLAKLALLSFTGAAAIKYGSLLTPIAASANPVLAVVLVVGPPLAYGAMLLRRGGS
ncbi:hypothetical protein FOA52_001018 [Chlamydomonas sp. UWO 241]|nr:hypothetical protein FOA52_001018 [Chlamydomonas sp. UWO 241]